MRLLLATSNPGKITEMQESLRGVEIVSPKEFGIVESPHETGSTFAENALQKARWYRERAGGIPTLADDSGIVVEALERELGIHTRRWGAGSEASDDAWIQFFLERMKHERNKRARFVCVLAYIDQDGNEHLFEGDCNGVITETLEANFLPGLPISACFRPEGYTEVYSAMSVAEKNAVSHRGKAVRAFAEFLVS